MGKENSELVITSRKDLFIRKLWHAHYAMAEAIKDLEDASDNIKVLNYEDLHPYQKDLIDLLGKFSNEIFFIPNNKIFTTAVQQDWLEFLEMILYDFKARIKNSDIIASSIEKVLLKKNTFNEIRTDISEIISPYYFSPTSILKLAYRIKKFKSKKIMIKDFQVEMKNIIEGDKDFTTLIKKRCENTFRPMETFSESDPTYPALAHPNFLNLDLDTFVKTAWDYRDTEKTDQGPKQEAKYILSKILQGSSSTSLRDISKEDYTKKYPIYFYSEDYPNRDEVLARISTELGFEIVENIYKQKLQTKNFTRPDVPAKRRLAQNSKLKKKSNMTKK